MRIMALNNKWYVTISLVDRSEGSTSIDFILTTRFATDAAQYAVDKANMNNVMPNVNMLDLDRNPRFL